MEYVIIYMAAGNSRRFGCNKLLKKMNGKPLYQHGLDAAAGLAAKKKNVRLIVITQYEEIAEQIRDMVRDNTDPDSARIRVFLNPESRRGVSETIRRGILEAEKGGRCDYFLFLTADQPWLKEETLERFWKMGEEGRCRMVSAAFGSRLGNPVMFAAEFAWELLSLSGDEGGRRIWKKHETEGTLIQVEEERELADIDFPEDCVDRNGQKCD